MRILVVDDDETYGQLVQRRLATEGYQVEYFKGPFGTIKHVMTSAPDLVLMDVNMPGLTGDALVGMLGKMGGTTRRPLVLLTSSLEAAELGNLAARIGADAWVSKSAPRQELLDKVRSLAICRMAR